MSPSFTDFEINFLINEIEVVWLLAAAEVFLYGVYLVIFGFYLHILHEGRMATHRFFAGATTSLFILCTVHCALELSISVFRTRAERVVDEDASSIVLTSLLVTANVLYVTKQRDRR
ncbi:hypothetical protein FB451DRAFT_1215830 [Mycena latifolia]|nr:hypothetical protein FB451DRAFT_1215830 [Mycena latifolia]